MYLAFLKDSRKEYNEILRNPKINNDLNLRKKKVLKLCKSALEHKKEKALKLCTKDRNFDKSDCKIYIKLVFFIKYFLYSTRSSVKNRHRFFSK